MLLPKIYPITNVNLAGISHAEQVEKLIRGGAELIQIREKEAPSNDFYESAKEAVEIAHKQNTKVIINDRVDIAVCANADGVHLGQDDLPAVHAREILGNEAIIGLSTHSIRQAVEALKLPIDYIAIGPIFDTATKSSPEKTLGIEELREIRNATGNFPLVAIGGISIDNFAHVLDAGADSAAMISSLISSADHIESNLRKMQESLKMT